MEQQRQQPTISIAQQIQKLQMNRMNRNLQKKPQSVSNSNGGDSASRVETYATLQKPPPNLMKSRKQQFHSPNGEHSFLREEPEPAAADDNSDGWSSTKRSKKDDDPPTIISGTLAAATAACYSPQPGGSTIPVGAVNPSTNSSKQPNHQNGSSSQQQRPAVIMSPTSSSTTSSSLATLSTVAAAQTKEQIFKSKLNPQLLSKIQQNMSNAGNVVANRTQGSPNGKAATNKIPIPKLMSKTKAQYQILRSQVTRPKVAPKSGGVPVPAPHSNVQQGVSAAGGNLGAAASSRPGIGAPQLSQQSQQNPANSNRLGTSMPQPHNRAGPPTTSPPMLTKQPMDSRNSRGGVGAGGSGVSKGGGRLPPPVTVPTMKGSDLLESVGKQFTVGARRGGIQVGRGRGGRGGATGRGSTHPGSAPDRRASLHSRESDSDEYGYSTPSPPPPAKTFRQSPKTPSPTRGGSAGRKNPPPGTTSPKKISASNISAPKKKDGEEERIYGKGYKCPPMDKVASYLTKKGVRIWICLVCEETEKEISRGPMICCDGCEDWYHFFCVGIEDEPPESVKWFCKRCIYKKLHNKNSSVDVKSESEDSDSDSSPSSKKSKGNSRASSSSPTRNRSGAAASPKRGGKAGMSRGGGRGGRGRK